MANTTQALWIVIIALSVSCAILLSLVIKSSYFKNQNNSTDIYGGYYGKVYPPKVQGEGSKDAKTGTKAEEVQPEGPNADLWHGFRLSPYVIPVHYDLLLHPDILSEKFTGQVNITVNVTRGIGALVVHKYKTLDISDSSVISVSDGRYIAVNRSFEYEPNEFWVIQTQKELVGGEVYVIRLTFGGALTGSIVGLYKSTYTNKKLNTSR